MGLLKSILRAGVEMACDIPVVRKLAGQAVEQVYDKLSRHFGERAEVIAAAMNASCRQGLKALACGLAAGAPPESHGCCYSNYFVLSEG